MQPNELSKQFDEFLQQPESELAAQIIMQIQDVVADTTSVLPDYLFASTVDQSPLAISITDKKANILYCNKSFEEVTGYSKGEIIGENETILSYRSTPKSVYEKMWTNLLEKKPWKGILVNRRKDGERYLAELLITPVSNHQGEVTHYVGIHTDCTQLHVLRKQVENQKAMIESVVDSAPDAIVVLDSAMKVIIDNHAYKKLMGDMHGDEPASIILNALKREDSQLNELLQQQKSFYQKEVKHYFDNTDSPRWFSCSAVWFYENSTNADDFFEQQQLPYLMLMIHEITTLKQQQDEIKNNAMRVVMAEDTLNAGVRETLSAAAFKMQEPLNLLNAAISMLSRDISADNSDLMLALLEKVSDKGHEAIQVMQEMMPKEVCTDCKNINLNQVIHEVLKLNTQRFLAEGIMLSWEPLKESPMVSGDLCKLRNLINLLIDNAIEAISEADPLQREIAIDTVATEDWIELAISDSGNGIDEEIRFKVFEPFFTTKRSTTEQHLGIGLALAQETINQYSGTLEVDADYQHGCRMRLHFPVEHQSSNKVARL